MNNQELQVFLNIIDGRIKKYINENKLLRQYCGQITNQIGGDSSKYKVKLLGEDEIEFTFLNKTGEVLSIGDYVYIQTVGNDLNTGVIMYKTQESIVPNNIIVEQGKANGWDYFKWSNGDAMCWTSVTSYATTVNDPYGNIYTSSSNPLSSISYPFEFIATPNESCFCNTGSAGVMTYGSSNTTTSTSRYIIWRGTPSNELISYRLSIFVLGKWK